MTEPAAYSLLKSALTLPGIPPIHFSDKASNADIGKFPTFNQVPEFDITKVCNNLGIKLEPFGQIANDDPPGQLAKDIQGYSRSDLKALCIRPSTPYPEQVAWHEIAHILLGHMPADGGPANEEEAEDVAYLLEKHYGFEAPQPYSRAYIQHYHQAQGQIEANPFVAFLQYGCTPRRTNQTKVVETALKIINANER